MRSSLMVRLGLASALVVAVLVLRPDGAMIFLGPPVLAILSKRATMMRRAMAFVIGFLVAVVVTFCLTSIGFLLIDLPDTLRTIGTCLILVANVVIPAYVTYECLRVCLSPAAQKIS